MLLRAVACLALLPSTFASTTIIDVLSSQAQYSTLVHHLQRFGLVPVINQNYNLTLVAPVNGAFAEDIPVTRDLLLYHILNGTFTSDSLHQDSQLVVNSLLSEDVDFDGLSVLGSTFPVIMAKNHGSLTFNNVPVADQDVLASESRGVVQSINELLQVPKDICSTLLDIKDSDVFRYLLTLDMESSAYCSNLDGGHLYTVLAPLNQAFEVFNDLELHYLTLDSSRNDRIKLVERHFVPALVASHSNRSLSTLDGYSIDFSGATLDRLLEPQSKDILASNGIIHTYSSLVQSDRSDPIIEFTPEKYLRALGADAFVDELVFHGMRHLIDGSTTSGQTIFVPNSFIDTFAAEVVTSADDLYYHFVDGQYDFAGSDSTAVDPEHEFLLTTKMETVDLDWHGQRLKLVQSPDGHLFVNGIQIVSDLYTVGNTSIYLIDGALDLPPSFASAIGPFLGTSVSIKFLKSLGYFYSAPTRAPWTALIPTREAWSVQSLLTGYLKHNQEALKTFFDHLIFSGSVYSDSGPVDVQFLSGDRLSVEVSNSSVAVGSQIYPIDSSDILFDSGVAYTVHNVFYPPELVVTAQDLIIANGREFILKYFEAANMSHVLDPDSPYTLLIPSEAALNHNNITTNSSVHDLQEIFELHVVEGNPIDDFMDGVSVKTLAGVDLQTLQVSDGFYTLQLPRYSGHETHILGRGDTSGGGGGGGNFSTIVFLDRYISPEWIDDGLIKGPYRLKTHIAVLLGLCLGVVLVFVFIVGMLYVVVHRTKDDEEATSPLLDEPTTSYGSTGSEGSEERTRPIKAPRSARSRDVLTNYNLPVTSD